MNSQGPRWIQQTTSFGKAFSRLKAAVELAAQRELSELEQQGLIQVFEYTHELAWKNLKDFLTVRAIQPARLLTGDLTNR